MAHILPVIEKNLGIFAPSFFASLPAARVCAAGKLSLAEEGDVLLFLLFTFTAITAQILILTDQ
jgi:hypothetical protein